VPVHSSPVARAIRRRTRRRLQHELDRLRRRVDRGHRSKDHQRDVDTLLFPCLRACPVVQHSGIDVAKRDAGEAADECDEFVQVLCAEGADERAECDKQKSDAVLLPLDLRVGFAAAVLEDACLDDSGRREELQWDG